MAEPKTENKNTQRSSEGKPLEATVNAAPVDELTIARARIAELERAVTGLERVIAERDDELAAAHRAHAHKERALEDALVRARSYPTERLAGEVVRMRARHTLYFASNNGPCKVVAGREFEASHEELARAELVEGKDFERVAG